MIKIRIVLDKTKQKQHKDGTHPVVLIVCEPNNVRTQFVLRGMNCHAEQFDNGIGRFKKQFPIRQYCAQKRGIAGRNIGASPT